MVDVNTQFGGFLTNLGAAKNANANALGQPWKLTHMLIGDANGADPAPSPGQTALVNEVYRAQLNQLYPSPVDENVLIAELVLPPNVGGWWIRELALEDEDGVFSAVAKCPPSYKPLLAQGSGRNQVVRMHVVTSGTANIQLKIDPSVVLATRAYCDGLIAVHNALANPHPQYALRGDVATLSATAAITPAQIGLVLLDASGGNRTFTLPAANATLGVREVVLRRVDTTSNVLVVVSSGTDKIMLDTTAEAEGQPSTELLFAGDYLRLRSDGAGKWWCVGQAQLPPSLTSQVSVFNLPGSHTFTVPPCLRSGRRHARVTVIGGGGGGGHTESTNGGGGGGGGGGRGIAIVNLAGVASVAVTVGVGGAGGASGTSNVGAPGGTSSFGAYASATGGLGGSQPSGAQNGSTFGVSIVMANSASGGGGYGTSAVTGCGGGAGGAGATLTAMPKGRNGQQSGGGGAGGGGTSGIRGGGDGAAGEVIVEVQQ